MLGKIYNRAYPVAIVAAMAFLVFVLAGAPAWWTALAVAVCAAAVVMAMSAVRTLLAGEEVEPR